MARNKLMGNRQAELIADRARYQRGDMVQLRTRFINPSIAPPGNSVKVELTRPGQASRVLELPKVAGSNNLSRGYEDFKRGVRIFSDLRLSVMRPEGVEGPASSTETKVDKCTVRQGELFHYQRLYT